jgi:hypothetical protein
MEVPNPKLQRNSKFQITNNFQARHRLLDFSGLKIAWDLEPGIWKFCAATE